MSGRIVILSGPSGVGKDTVLEAWQARDPRVVRVVACTTRPPRPGEVDGVDYEFCTPDEFLRQEAEGAFLESKRVHGNYYATPLATLNRLLGEGKVAVLKIDVQGALTAMEKRPDAVSIFILPPSMAELEHRLRARGTESDAAIAERLRNAREEIAAAEHYHHHVVNSQIEEAVDAIQAIVGAPCGR